MKRLIATILTLVLVIGVFTGCSNSKSNDKVRIALITMDSVDQYWVSLKEGAIKAADEIGVDLRFMAPNVRDIPQQIECINNAVSAGAKAILIAADNPEAATLALKEASEQGVKIIYVDAPANAPAEVTYCTDNQKAGHLAGEEMLTALKDAGITEGKIGIVNVNAATTTAIARETGFIEALEGSVYEILGTQYSEGDISKSQTIAENYITQGVVGIFGANEGTATGVGNAIKASENDSVIGIGFDNSDAITTLIEDGYLKATMCQNPELMGYKGVYAAMEILNGKEYFGEVIDTGVSVIKPR